MVRLVFASITNRRIETARKITIEEYYQWMFENSVPGLPEEAAKHDLTPLEYMRKYGAFLVENDAYESHLKSLSDDSTQTAVDGSITRDGATVGIKVGDTPHAGFKTPSKRLEIYSPTMAQWGWEDQTLPGYIRSHVHRDNIDHDNGGFVLVPTFRLPTLIHTRAANAKWLYELSNTNPVWMHPSEADRLGIQTTDLIRVTTDIGHFVNRAWVTEGIRPGIVACSHHLGRWRLHDQTGTDRWASSKVVREETGAGVYRFRRVENVQAFESSDPDTKRIWWTDGGVHQNLTFPVHPDPISGMHCWHQLVTVSKAKPGDQYADICVDTNKSMQVYREWLSKTRPGPGPGGLRRPLWIARRGASRRFYVLRLG